MLLLLLVALNPAARGLAEQSSTAASTVAPAPASSQQAPDYSKEAFLVLSSESHVRFLDDGRSQQTQTTRVKMLSDAALRTWGVLAFDYASENEHLDVHYVRVLKADGVTVNTPAGNIMDLPSDVTRQAPMYSDLKQKQIPVKSLGVGDTLEFEVSHVEDKPLVPGQFWFVYSFTRSSVVLRELLEVRVPRDRQPKVVSAELKPTVSEEGSERVYRWSTAHTEGTIPEEDEPEAPEHPSVQLSTFANWEQVGAWYHDLSLPQAQVTPAIQAKADALVKGLPAGEARIQAIYDFVATKIHYVGLSFGIGRYQPHAAADVLDNEYGDCKDKHTLLAALLKAEGIESWPVLISSSTKIDADVPSLGQFDHMITLVPEGKGQLWLDTTPEVAPYGMLLKNLRDKDALALPVSGPARLIRTPADPPFPVEDHFVMKGALDGDGTFRGHGEITLRGDSEVMYRELFQSSARAKAQDLMQTISYRLGFAGEVSNVQVDDPDATHNPYRISWDYVRKKYGDWDNHRITPPTGGIPMNMVSEFKAPKTPIQVGLVGVTRYEAELTLPAGSSLEAPTDVDLKAEFAEYHAHYSVSGGKYVCERRFVVFKDKIPVDQWKPYLAFQKALLEDYNHFSVINGLADESGKPMSAEAEDLVRDAAAAVQNHQLAKAQDDLDKARKLNPHELNLNAMDGTLKMMSGHVEEALKEFEAELKDHPENLRMARYLVQLLANMHREDEAIGVDRELLKQAPNDPDATTELARLLVNKQAWKDAQPVLESAVKLRPDNGEIQVWYGQACLANGKVDEGVAALKGAAASSTDVEVLAKVASALPDAGTAAEMARETGHHAVTLMEQQTAGLTLAELTNSQLKSMVELATVWTEMSATLLKTGDLESAERYARAAWNLSEEPVAGDQLGQVLERQGKLAAALDAYMLAEARAYPVVPGLSGRLEGLRKRVELPKDTSGDSRRQMTTVDRLQGLRTIRITPPKPFSGSADFLALFENGKISDVRPMGGDPRAVALAGLLKQSGFHVPFPDDGPERIIRQGILSCSVYDTKCMLLMMLPGDATTNSRPQEMQVEKPVVIRLEKENP